MRIRCQTNPAMALPLHHRDCRDSAAARILIGINRCGGMAGEAGFRAVWSRRFNFGRPLVSAGVTTGIVEQSIDGLACSVAQNLTTRFKKVA